MKIKDKILTLRKRFGLSQEELANELNVARQTVSKWENGVMNPDTDKIVLMSKLFNVSTDVLLIDEYELPDPNESTMGSLSSQSEKRDEDFVESKKSSKNLFKTGIILTVLSIVGLSIILLLKAFSPTMGDVTVIYSTWYVSLKTIFITLVLLFVSGVAIILYKGIKSRCDRKKREKTEDSNGKTGGNKLM